MHDYRVAIIICQPIEKHFLVKFNAALLPTHTHTHTVAHTNGLAAAHRREHVDLVVAAVVVRVTVYHIISGTSKRKNNMSNGDCGARLILFVSLLFISHYYDTMTMIVI